MERNEKLKNLNKKVKSKKLKYCPIINVIILKTDLTNYRVFYVLFFILT